MLTPNDNNAFLVNGDPNFMNGPAEPLKVSSNPPYRVLDILVFHNLISPDKRFDKDLRIFVIFLSVNNDLFEQLLSPTIMVIIF